MKVAAGIENVYTRNLTLLSPTPWVMCLWYRGLDGRKLKKGKRCNVEYRSMLNRGYKIPDLGRVGDRKRNQRHGRRLAHRRGGREKRFKFLFMSGTPFLRVISHQRHRETDRRLVQVNHC